LAVAEAVESPLVIDADGIRAFARQSHLVARRASSTVMTPHEGELAALLGCRRSDISSDRLASARRASVEFSCTVVLKGDDTLVCDPTGRVGISRGGSAALATAGTGDVLSGLLAALLARGVEPWWAACAAVAIHAEAGRIAATEKPEGVIASDVAHALPSARESLLRQGGL
jgi:NAD(P)H-hydrate epimerase